MTYTSAVDHLYALGHELAPPTPQPGAPATPRRKFDLAHMRTLAHALGDPHLTFSSILIAGTNGKGSTAATLASILAASGVRTALYTSPHLSRVNERIQITGPSGSLQEIPDDTFARLYFRVDDAARHLVSSGQLPHAPSFFEVLTALAFCYFAEPEPGAPPVDIAVLEVGLGGRLDATNIVSPLLSLITDIALDHQDYLGPTLTDIAREKCGILRPNGTLITLPQHPAVNQVIGEVAATLPNLRALSAAHFIPANFERHREQGTGNREQGAERPPASQPSHSQPSPTGPSASTIPHPEHAVPCSLFPVPSPSSLLPPNRYTLTFDGAPLHVDSPLPGQHQQRNIALAIAAAESLRNHSSSNLALSSNQSGYNITIPSIEAGIRNTRWPGRLELLPDTPDILLDVAHNPAGAWTLRAAIAQLPESRPRTLLFSCLRDKSLTELAQILFPLFDSSPDGSPSRPLDHILFAPIDNPRAAAIEDLLAAAHALAIPAQAAPSLAEALAEARRLTPPNGLILATGSIYLIGELRHLVAPE